jgi:glycogen phosphorylase
LLQPDALPKGALDQIARPPRIAYFSMEMALAADVPTYSGGLGVLAGDTLRSAADLLVPIIGVTLVSRCGYFRQELADGGRQIEHEERWDPSRVASLLPAKVSVNIEGREVWIGAWLYMVKGNRGHDVPVILLDTELAENAEEDRNITSRLYGGDAEYRLKQEIVLGIGGVRMLSALGFSLRKYHMNEGHSALLSVELLRRLQHHVDDVRDGEIPYDPPRVRERCIFTTHTPIEAGHDRFSWELVEKILGTTYIDMDVFKKLGGEEELNMTRLALNLSEYVNGVAERHAETSRKMFPGYRVAAITNGVHPQTWVHPVMARLFDRFVPGWETEPQNLVRADQIPDDMLLEAHAIAKQQLIDLVQQRAGVSLDPRLPIVGFARRMTAYKRPELLFSEMERLKQLAVKQPFQIVLAGKAHPRDEAGKKSIERLCAAARELAGTITIAFIPNYDVEVAGMLVAGVDVWLNTPARPYEASGTSGMKAALNGVPSLSVPDGWWIEGCVEGVTGWAIGDGNEQSNDRDHDLLYQKLEEDVLPLLREGGPRFAKLMKGCVSKNGSFFNSHRMMLRYVVEAYIH